MWILSIKTARLLIFILWGKIIVPYGAKGKQMKITEKLLLSLGGQKLRSSDDIAIGFDFGGEKKGYHFRKKAKKWEIGLCTVDGWEYDATVETLEEVITWLLQIAIQIGETKKLRHIQSVLGIR